MGSISRLRVIPPAINRIKTDKGRQGFPGPPGSQGVAGPPGESAEASPIPANTALGNFTEATALATPQTKSAWLTWLNAATVTELNALGSAVSSISGGLLALEEVVATKVSNDDSRLINSREWIAATISQAEAEAGTATDRRAFTAQRVRQSAEALNVERGVYDRAGYIYDHPEGNRALECSDSEWIFGSTLQRENLLIAMGLGQADSPTFAGVNFGGLGSVSNTVIHNGTPNTGVLFSGATGNNFSWVTAGVERIRLGSGGRISASDGIGLSGSASTPHVILLGDAANISAQRNGTNAQVARWYKTFVDNNTREYFEIDCATSPDNIDLAVCGGLSSGARGLRIGSKYVGSTSLTTWLTINSAGAATFISPVSINSSGGLRINSGSSTQGGVVSAGDNGFRPLQFGGTTYNSNGLFSIADGSVIGLRSGGGFYWRADNNPVGGTAVTGLVSTSGGLIEINNGTLGQFRDLNLRNLSAVGNVGIGTSTPTAKLDVYDINSGLANFTNTAASSPTGGAGMIGLANDGAALANGDRLGFFLLGGSNSTSSTNNSCGMAGFATENWTSTACGARLDFLVQPNGTSGTASRIAALSLNHNGAATFVGNITASGNLTALSGVANTRRGLYLGDNGNRQVFGLANTEMEPNQFIGLGDDGVNLILYPRVNASDALKGGLQIRTYRTSQTSYSTVFSVSRDGNTTVNQLIVGGTGSASAPLIFLNGAGAGNEIGLYRSGFDCIFAAQGVPVLRASYAAGICTVRDNHFGITNAQFDAATVGADTRWSRSSAGVWRAGTTANNALGSVELFNLTAGGNITATGFITSAFQSLSADPSTIDIPSGANRIVKNTTSGEVRDWVNDGGVMKKSPAYT